MKHLEPKVIHKILPESQVGSAKLVHRVVSQNESTASMYRSALVKDFGADLAYTPPGKYAMLTIDNEIVMSETLMERRSNANFIYRANGKVLIAGLGIGMILTAIYDKPEVDSIIVVEKNTDVIKLVSPYIRHQKLSVVEGDIFGIKEKLKEYKPFDTIYFDIWPNISMDNLEQINKLHHMYKNFLNRQNPDCWMGSWMHSYLKLWRRRGYR